MFFYLLFLNIYYWENLTFSKLVEKVNFSGRKFEEMQSLWRARGYKVYLGKRLFWHYYLQLSFVYKTVSQNSFKFFFSGDKSPLVEFLMKWARDIMNVSPNILAIGNFENLKFGKLRQRLLNERVLITTALMSFCRWKTLKPFY